VFVYFKIYSLTKQYGIGSREFVKLYGVGITAHLSLLLRFLLIYFIVKIRKYDFFIWLLIILILFSIVIYGSKTWLIIPIISGLLIRFVVYRHKIHISIKLLISIFTFIFTVFFIIYYFTVGQYIELTDYLFFLINRIALYFFAGITSFSEYLKYEGEIGVNPLMVIASPINIINKLTGHEIKATTSAIWNIININGDTSNVKTLIGSIYIYSGWYFFIIYVFLFSTLYYVMLLVVYLKENFLALIIYFFWITLLLFGWFDMYYANLAFYEIPIWGLIIYFLTKLRRCNFPKS
jgi:hypothetical protein